MCKGSFETELLDTYEQAARHGYRPTYFLRMLQKHGGVEAARRLLASEEVTEGLMRLWELKLLHISVEAIVLKPEYRVLFSDAERARARRRLAELNYRAPWDSEVDE